jgi:hypothetical protein
MSACTAAAYTFTVPTCTTIIALEPCALNAEFQHFIPRFNKISLLCRPLKEGIGGEREGDVKDKSNVSKSLAIENHGKTIRLLDDAWSLSPINPGNFLSKSESCVS